MCVVVSVVLPSFAGRKSRKETIVALETINLTISITKGPMYIRTEILLKFMIKVIEFVLSNGNSQM